MRPFLRPLIIAAAVGATTALVQPAPAPARARELVARAAGQELSLERLAAVIGGSQVPATVGNMSAAAELWINYQLLAYAAAHNEDVSADTRIIDEAMWDQLLEARVQRFYDVVRRNFPAPDTAKLAQMYAEGKILAAQHILIMMPEDGFGMSDRKKDSLRHVAEDLLRRVTPSSFSELAEQYTQDPSGKTKKGSAGVFVAGDGTMVPEFEAAVSSLRPGQISATLVQTSYGFHIIRRYLFSEVRDEVREHFAFANEETAKQNYVAGLRRKWNVAYVPKAPAIIRAVVSQRGSEAVRRDATPIATSRAGAFTSAKLARWLETSAAQQKHVTEFLAGASDSAALSIVQRFIDREILATEAEGAGIGPEPDSIAKIHAAFLTMVNIARKDLKLEPANVATFGTTPDARARVAAGRIDELFAKMIESGGEGFVEIPPAVTLALRLKYAPQLNSAALARATHRASQIKIALDSMNRGRR